MYQDLSKKKMDQLIAGICSIGIRPEISGDKSAVYKKRFESKSYFKVISRLIPEIEKSIKIVPNFVPDSELLTSLQNQPFGEIALQFVRHHNIPLDSTREPACVFIPGNIPMINTEAFSRHKTRMEIGESLKYESWETFVTCMVHELAHVLLRGIWHPLAKSEIATDLAVIVLGFGEIMKRGRFMRGGARLGYLTDKQFDYAYHSIRLKQENSLQKKAFSALYVLTKSP